MFTPLHPRYVFGCTLWQLYNKGAVPLPDKSDQDILEKLEVSELDDSLLIASFLVACRVLNALNSLFHKSIKHTKSKNLWC